MTSLLSIYLNQTATWRRKTGRNQFNEPTFEELQIAVRWESDITMVRNADGVEVTSSAKLLTEAPVQIGDSLIDNTGREWPVITVGWPTTLGGMVHHREVRV